MDIVSHLIDIILLFLCLFFAAMAAKKGFIKATLDFVFSVIATVAAWFVSNTFCDEVYSMFVRERLLTAIDQRVISGVSQSVDSVVASVPAWITDSAAKLGLIQSSENISGILSAGLTAENIEKTLIGPIAVFVVKIILFILVSVLLGIILRIVSYSIGKAVRKSAGKSIDIALGAVLGIFKGVIISLIVSLLLYFIAYMIPDSDFTRFVDASYFCKIAVSLLNLI